MRQAEAASGKRPGSSARIAAPVSRTHTLGGHFASRDLDGDHSTRWRELHRVLEQVPQDLRDARGVRVDPDLTRGQVVSELDTARVEHRGVILAGSSTSSRVVHGSTIGFNSR